MMISRKFSLTLSLRTVLLALSLIYSNAALAVDDPQPTTTATPSAATSSTSTPPASSTTEDTATGETTAGKTAADYFYLQQQNLAAELKPEELVWLDVNYPESSENVQALALLREPRTPQAHGAALILHDKEQHPDWPHLIRPIRLGLPDAGWYTLAIALPYENTTRLPERDLPTKHSESMTLTQELKVNLAKSPEREKPTENTESQANAVADTKKDVSTEETDSSSENVDINLSDKGTEKTKLVSYEDRALAHVKSALDHIASAGYQNVVIVTYRGSANIALKHIKPFAPTMTNQGFALVMINPILNSEFQHDFSKAVGKDFLAPVLDIVDSTNIDNNQLARERLMAARASNIANYHQTKLAITAGSRQRTLLKKIRYWLETYAPGMAATKVSQN